MPSSPFLFHTSRSEPKARQKNVVVQRALQLKRAGKTVGFTTSQATDGFANDKPYDDDQKCPQGIYTGKRLSRCTLTSEVKIATG